MLRELDWSDGDRADRTQFGVVGDPGRLGSGHWSLT